MTDCLMEKTLCRWYGKESMYGNTPCRETENCNVLRIAPKCWNVLLYPPEGCNLIHECITSFRLLRMFSGQCREGEMTQAAKAVINAYENDTLLGKTIP